MTIVKVQTPNLGALDFTAFEYHSTKWHEVGGIYIFCSATGEAWQPHYVGQTNNFRARLPHHERWTDAKRMGATHVLARVVPYQSERDKIEAALIAQLQPTLNTQLRQPWSY